VALDPSAAEARHHLSLAHAARGDRGAARAELERLLEIDPDNVRARIDVALYLLSEGHAPRALDELDRALALDGSNVRARFYRAAVLDIAGRAAEAEEVMLDIASGDDPKYADRARRYLTNRMQRKEKA